MQNVEFGFKTKTSDFKINIPGRLVSKYTYRFGDDPRHQENHINFYSPKNPTHAGKPVVYFGNGFYLSWVLESPDNIGLGLMTFYREGKPGSFCICAWGSLMDPKNLEHIHLSLNSITAPSDPDKNAEVITAVLELLGVTDYEIKDNSVIVQGRECKFRKTYKRKRGGGGAYTYARIDEAKFIEKLREALQSA